MGAASGNRGAEAPLGGACPGQKAPPPGLGVQKLVLEVGSHLAGSEIRRLPETCVLGVLAGQRAYALVEKGPRLLRPRVQFSQDLYDG